MGDYMGSDSSARQLAAAKRLIGDLADKLDLDAHVRLWDGSRTPLGRSAAGPFELSIAGSATTSTSASTFQAARSSTSPPASTAADARSR